MIDPQQQHSFLTELDARQDQVLQELDALNSRVEQILKQTSNRGKMEEVAQQQSIATCQQPQFG